jgi:hypothetical protein
MVVGEHDIIPINEVLFNTPLLSPNAQMMGTPFTPQYTPGIQNLAQPTPPVYVNISPKFINDGNDQSSTTAPTPVQTIESTPMLTTPNVQISTPIMQPSVRSNDVIKPDESPTPQSTEDIFSNPSLLKIVKK